MWKGLEIMKYRERYALVIVAYNREKSLKRLLNSIDKAEFFGDLVDVIISIDKSDNINVLETARNFEWVHGEKIVVEHSERMGLRNHILSCGSYTQMYKAIAVLEDDLIVSPSFYSYMKAATEFYKEDDQIAGISLYSHQWNEGANAPFYPLKYDYDTFFIQYAQSWGQVWIQRQWEAFYSWYLENMDIFEKESEKEFPANIAGWSKNSWLKYHIKYCVEKDKYFVYPYTSYTTNFTEIGTHYKTSITRFQVPMEMGVKTQYHFCKFDENAIKYDVFFENVNLIELLKEKYPNIYINLYGHKQKKNAKYCLSTKKIDRKIIETFGLQCRPWETNIMYEIEGNEIFVYDMEVAEKNPNSKKDMKVKLWDYYMKERFFMLDELFPVFMKKMLNFVKSIYVK